MKYFDEKKSLWDEKPAGIKSGMIIFAVLCLALLFAGGRSALTQSEPPSEPAEEPNLQLFPSQNGNLWFVELRSAPLAEAGKGVKEDSYRKMLQEEKQAFRASAAAAGIGFRERYSYDLLWNGLSVEIDPFKAADLLHLPEVADIYPVALVQAPPRPIDQPPDRYQPDMFSAANMTGVTAAHDAGYTGSGVKVAIIDTGVDYNHPDLGGPGFPNSRIVGGYDLVGDNYSPGTVNPPAPYSDLPQPDPDPMDCNGHGTHVSGIVGADGTLRVTGVAPGANIRMYRVFGCSGSTSDDVILAALEMALADGNQIVNMSLGNNYGWPQHPVPRAADNLVNRGVVVVAAAGNSGDYFFSMSAPGTGKKTIGVGSVINNYMWESMFTRPWPESMCLPRYYCGCPDPPWIYYRPAYNSPLFPISGTETVVNVGCSCSKYLPLPVDVAGKVAVIQGLDFNRDAEGKTVPCSDWEQINNLKNVGATAVLLFIRSSYVDNCSAVNINIFNGDEQPVLPLPVASISRYCGEIFNIIKTSTLTWGLRPNWYEVGSRSYFSSVGPSPDLAFKPDLLAPGGDIYSTYLLPNPDRQCHGGPYTGCPPQWFAVLRGTSMAAPHVAGAAALVLEAWPKTPSQKVRDLLQNSAVPVLARDPYSSKLDHIQGQGAGLLDINAAVHAKTVITPGSLSLGETEGTTITRTLEIENRSETGLTYDLSHQPALANKPYPAPLSHRPSPVVSSANLTFSSESLYVPAGGASSVAVTITEPSDLPQGGLFGGFIVVTPQGGVQVVRVPYMGYKGDYQQVPIFTKASSYGNPILRHSSSFGKSEPVVIDRTNASTADDKAYYFFHLEFPVRKLKVEILPESGGPMPLVSVYNYVERSGNGGYYFIRSWDGSVGDSLVPSGTYFIRLSAQKPQGDDDNPADWETWTSPKITVIR